MSTSPLNLSRFKYRWKPLGFAVVILGLGGMVLGCASETSPRSDPAVDSAPSTDNDASSEGETSVVPEEDASNTPEGMVLIPAGPFEMGCSPDDDLCERDEQPLHTVTLDDYFIGVHEVTNAEYASCVSAGACDPPSRTNSETRDNYYGDEAFADFPVNAVTWDNANDYCQWEGGRLPTEAEWEKAARGAEDTRIYPWGAAPPSCELGNIWLNGTCVGDTTEVGSYPDGASPYGVLDMAGNLPEWVSDWYDHRYYQNSPAENPTGPDSGQGKVVRGGGWFFHPPLIFRVSDRDRQLPESTRDGGFRCAAEPGGD